MQYAEDILALIGNTPLLKLKRVTEKIKPLVLAKLEFMNPGGSVKDRIGVAMLRDAIESGRIAPGGTIVEPTSGNTGVGLALACIILGFKLIVTMPDKMSLEKKHLLEAYGARVMVCPSNVPRDDPQNYIVVAKRITEEMQDAFMPDQYSNKSNPEAHYKTTGREIWEQTEGKITHFVAGMGTGGTISGVSRYLKEKNPNVRIVGVDPEGSIFYGAFNNKKVIPTQYKIEGIGEDFTPKTMDLKRVDEVVSVSDREAYLMAKRLAREEALLVGSSSGAAVFGALRISKNLDKNDVVVTLLPDRGERYLSKLYNEGWMNKQGFA